jgi:hypothetical protein
MGGIVENVRFADRVFRLLERTKYRRAETVAERNAIYRMRYAAYLRAGTVALGSSGMFSDPFDDTDNGWLIGVHIDGELASALRLHVSSSPRVRLPASDSFSDVLDPVLEAGRIVIDASRFVARYDFSMLHSEIPYLTLRPTFLAEEFFGADFVTAACLVEHQAFYRRMFGGVPWCPPREFPYFKRRMAFLGYDCNARREGTHARYPFYQSSERERTRLFSRSSNGAENVFEAIGRKVFIPSAAE